MKSTQAGLVTGEQICLKGAEVGGFELQGQGLRHGAFGDELGEADDVDGLHVVVGQAVPRGLWARVLHVAFPGMAAFEQPEQGAAGDKGWAAAVEGL